MKISTTSFFILIAILFSFTSCVDEEVSSINPINWKKRMVELSTHDSLTKGTTYLSVYSQIYSITEHRLQNLTVTVSMRNTNRADTIYINHAEYYGTNGKLIRTYFNRPIFIAPLETVEIIIDEVDREGGSGANFLFDWTIKPSIDEPFFEAVMISTAGSQGLSFVTVGRQVK